MSRALQVSILRLGIPFSTVSHFHGTFVFAAKAGDLFLGPFMAPAFNTKHYAINPGSSPSNRNLSFDRVVVRAHSLGCRIEEASARQRLHICMDIAVIALERLR